MRQCMDAENLHRRLKKIIGQVQAIDRMIDEDVPYEDVLAQINAAPCTAAARSCSRGTSSIVYATGSSTATPTKRSKTSRRPWSASRTWAEACTQDTGKAQSFDCAFFFSLSATYTPICILYIYPIRYKRGETMKTLMEKLERLLELGGTKKDIALLAIGGIALVCSLLKRQPLPFDLAWIAVVLCGVPIVLEAVIGLVTAFDIKADVLVSLALIASVCIGEIFAAGEVAFIMQLGGLLEELTVAKARAGIEKFVHLTPQTARVLAPDGTETVVPAEQVQVGDTLRVLPGESVPVDGVIRSGRTSINQAVMTGESLPVDKGPGDEVSSGTVNQFGAFEMRATKVGADSSIQRMIRLERLAAVRCIAFDKTGTLTRGTPEVVCARSIAPGSDDAALYRLAASAEQLSEHPLGKAITASYRQSGGTPMAAAEGFQMVPGRGVCATVDGRRVLAGNTELLAIIGTLDPVIGALVHNAGSVLVITNSALLLNRRRSSWQSPSSASSSAQ